MGKYQLKVLALDTYLKIYYMIVCLVQFFQNKLIVICC